MFIALTHGLPCSRFGIEGLRFLLFNKKLYECGSQFEEASMESRETPLSKTAQVKKSNNLNMLEFIIGLTTDSSVNFL